MEDFYRVAEEGLREVARKLRDELTTARDELRQTKRALGQAQKRVSALLQQLESAEGSERPAAQENLIVDPGRSPR